MSDRNTFEVDERPVIKQEKSIKIPARYGLIDKVNKWGVDIRNPTAVRQLERVDQPENDMVFTNVEGKQRRGIAVKQIEKRF